MKQDPTTPSVRTKFIRSKMKTHPEALKILVALAKEARFYLHECNVAGRRWDEAEKSGAKAEVVNNLDEDYVQSQRPYVDALNCLSTAKRAVGRE
jgi:hypothetical protein